MWQRNTVSIKDELQIVKEELTSDEKMLESAFRLERLYKKYKKMIWTVIALTVIGFGGKAAWGIYLQNKLDAANASFLTLQKNPNDPKAREILKKNNPKLFALFELSQAVKSGSADTLKPLASSKDMLIADIARYHAGVLEGQPVDVTYYHDLAVVEEAWIDLKSGKKTEARNKLSLIGENSPVAKIAQLLKHYTIELK